MNRTRLYVGLLGAIFVAAIGVGVVVGDEDRPMQEVASTFEATTTTVARTTTTRAPTTTTTTKAPTTTTTAAPATTVAPRPVTTLAPVPTQPPVTEPATTVPPTTEAPTTTTTVGFDPVKCADINTSYLNANAYDDPTRVALLKLNNCPPYYWQ